MFSLDFPQGKSCPMIKKSKTTYIIVFWYIQNIWKRHKRQPKGSQSIFYRSSTKTKILSRVSSSYIQHWRHRAFVTYVLLYCVWQNGWALLRYFISRCGYLEAHIATFVLKSNLCLWLFNSSLLIYFTFLISILTEDKIIYNLVLLKCKIL